MPGDVPFHLVRHGGRTLHKNGICTQAGIGERREEVDFCVVEDGHRGLGYRTMTESRSLRDFSDGKVEHFTLQALPELRGMGGQGLPFGPGVDPDVGGYRQPLWIVSCMPLQS